MDAEINNDNNNFQTVNNTISDEVYKDSVTNVLTIPAINTICNSNIEAEKDANLVEQQEEVEVEQPESNPEHVKVKKQKVKVPEINPTHLEWERKHNSYSQVHIYCLDDVFFNIIYKDEKYMLSITEKCSGNKYFETKKLLYDFNEEIKNDIINFYHYLDCSELPEILDILGYRIKKEFYHFIYGMKWVYDESKQFHFSKNEIIEILKHYEHELNEAGYDGDDFFDAVRDYTHAEIVKKQNKEVIIEIPDHDNFKFTITYNDKYFIKIQDIKMKYLCKRPIFEFNKTKDKEIADFINEYAGIDKNQAKELVKQLNLKITGEFYKQINALRFKEAETEELETEEQKATPESYEKPEIMQKGEEILKHGNPHDYMMESFQKLHKGDKIAFSCIFLAVMNQSIKNSKGLQVSMNGGSGGGKSHCSKSTIRLIPRKYVIDSSLSSKALFYHPNLKDRTIIYSDDTEISPDLENTLKRSMTNFQEITEHLTVDGDRKGKQLFIPKRIVYLFTSVEEKGGDEFQNRKIPVTIEESVAHKYDIVKKQFENVKNGYDPYLNENTEDILICQAMFDILHKQDFGVSIPYVDYIEGYDLKNVRNNDKFFNMIMGFTLSKFMQREKDSNGNLIATEEDFNNAAEIYNKIYKNVTSNLTDAEIRMCKAIASHGLHGATSKDLQETLKISQSKVSERLKKLVSKVPNLQYDDGSDSTGSNDGNGNTSSHSRYVTRYFLPRFDEVNFNKAVYLAKEKIDFNQLIEQAKVKDKELRVQEMKALANNMAENIKQSKPKKLHISLNDSEDNDTSITA